MQLQKLILSAHVCLRISHCYFVIDIIIQVFMQETGLTWMRRIELNEEPARNLQ